jgi:hypothetical protein
MTAIQTLKVLFDRLKQWGSRIQTSALLLTTLTTGSAPEKIDRDRDGTDDRAEGAGKGAGIGAGLGGAAGLLAGLGLLAIPGLGPVVAAGWLAATAVGAQRVLPREGLWELSRKRAFRKKMRHCTPKAPPRRNVGFRSRS